MCGIVGYVGKKQAVPILIKGLLQLEYRGYDSAGLALHEKGKTLRICKAEGRVRALEEKIGKVGKLEGYCGIAHTRWATHGTPSEANAHPHFSANNAVVVVHNGILENFSQIKERLIGYGYSFYSQTDTEVIAKLLDYYLKQHNHCPIAAITALMDCAQGSYALAVLFRDYPEEIYAIRKDSPLLIGEGEKECFLASDPSAFPFHVRRTYVMGNREFARLQAETIEFYNGKGDRIEKESTQIYCSREVVEKGGYAHFMRKEMQEQPTVVENTLQWLFRFGKTRLFSIKQMQACKQIYITACGSAYHAGLVLQYVIEHLAHVPVRVELASEFRYRGPLVTEETLVIAISQSGETADSLAALREAKRLGARTLAIVNVLGSSIAREADNVLYTQAGREIAVATTKAYSAQLIVGYWLAMELAKARRVISLHEYEKLWKELHALPEKIERVLQEEERFQLLAKQIVCARDVFFIGRGVDYAVSMEGSLKMKEISYIHSEAYAAGELKHGTLSLIEEGVWTVGVLTQEEVYQKTCSNLQEIKSRGGKLLVITTKEGAEIADCTLCIPRTEEIFYASLTVIPMQFLAYYASVEKGLDVDKPRNLAKSVTVE